MRACVLCFAIETLGSVGNRVFGVVWLCLLPHPGKTRSFWRFRDARKRKRRDDIFERGHCCMGHAAGSGALHHGAQAAQKHRSELSDSKKRSKALDGRHKCFMYFMHVLVL